MKTKLKLYWWNNVVGTILWGLSLMRDKLSKHLSLYNNDYVLSLNINIYKIACRKRSRWSAESPLSNAWNHRNIRETKFPTSIFRPPRFILAFLELDRNQKLFPVSLILDNFSPYHSFSVPARLKNMSGWWTCKSSCLFCAKLWILVAK